jgi:hypothetical protein
MMILSEGQAGECWEGNFKKKGIFFRIFRERWVGEYIQVFALISRSSSYYFAGICYY